MGSMRQRVTPSETDADHVRLRALEGRVAEMDVVIAKAMTQVQDGIGKVMTSIISIERDATRMLSEAAARTGRYPRSIYLDKELDQIETASTPGARAVVLDRVTGDAARRLAGNPESIGWRTAEYADAAGDRLRERLRLLGEHISVRDDMAAASRILIDRRNAIGEIGARVEAVVSTGRAPSEGMISEMDAFVTAIGLTGDRKELARLAWAIQKGQPVPVLRADRAAAGTSAPTM